MEKAKIIYNGKEAEILLTDELLELFKKKEKKKRFIPKLGEIYFCIDFDGAVDSCQFDNDDYDKGVISLGNCYRTEAEAIFAIERQKLLIELQDFADENNNEIDFGKPTEKYRIVFSCAFGITYHRLYTDKVYQLKNMDIYFSSKEIAEKAIEKFGERMKKYIFEVR